MSAADSYNLTIDEKPAAHALNRAVGKKVWAISEELTGLSKYRIDSRKSNRLINLTPQHNYPVCQGVDNSWRRYEL